MVDYLLQMLTMLLASAPVGCVHMCGIAHDAYIAFQAKLACTWSRGLLQMLCDVMCL